MGGSAAYSPKTFTINVGDKVTWLWKANNHSVTSDPGGSELDSGVKNTGATYSHTFNTPGTYAYHCIIHSNMHGTIVVNQ